jgi:hypothetical protein
MEKHPLLHHPKRRPYTLVIHGGAGTMRKEHSTPEQRVAYTNALSQALLAVSFLILFICLYVYYLQLTGLPGPPR